MIGQFTGGATLIASITGMDHVTSLLIFGTVVVLYTAIGGFRSPSSIDHLADLYRILHNMLQSFES